jgi:hypothetical protein
LEEVERMALLEEGKKILAKLESERADMKARSREVHVQIKSLEEKRDSLDVLTDILDGFIGRVRETLDTH